MKSSKDKRIALKRLIVIMQKLKRNAISFMIAGVISALCISYITVKANENEIPKWSEREELIYLVQTSLAKGDLDAAGNYLDQIYLKEGDSGFTALAAARLQMLYGNYEEAYILYQKAELLNTNNSNNISQDEIEFYQKAIEDELITPTKAFENLTMATYIKEQGHNPADYGYSDKDNVSPDQIEYQIETITAAILDSINQDIQTFAENKDSPLKNLEEALEFVQIIETEYNRYLEDGYYDEATMKDAIKNLSKVYRKTSDLFRMKELDETYIKGLTLLKQYNILIEYAERSGSQFALAMVANLYTSEHISKKDFSDTFVLINRDEYDAVIGQCEEALDRIEDQDIDELIIEELDLIIKKLETLKKNPILAELDRRIQPETIQRENQSKIYLQKTNVNYELGDDKKADTSLQAALDTALYSDDLSYSEPMKELIDIINENSDSEEIKNAQSYLKDAYQNSLPVQPENEIIIAEAFTQKASAYISTKRAMINIGYVNTKDFPTIKANVQFSSPIDLSDQSLAVTDCNRSITDFTIERKIYKKLRVYLVCDISGSMGGSEGELQAAVRQFMSKISSNEEVALVGFSSYVEFDSGFTKKPEDLETYIEQLYANGGTEIGTATYYSIDQFPVEADTSNVIILMTDGNDSSFYYNSDLEELRRRCEEKNILLYTIGLGADISAEYLENIASYGNGKFVYSSDAVSLQSLYDFIHKQIDNNYLITFEAKNQTDNLRELQVSNQADHSIGKKRYQLTDTSEEGYDFHGAEENTSKIREITDGVLVTGVDTATIYKSDSVGSSFQILGKGFLNVSDINVSLEGTNNYHNLKATVTNDGHIQVEVGSNVLIGEYTVVVTLDHQLFRLDQTIQIVKSGGEKTITFGAYQFTAQTVSRKGNECILYGNVVMNDYLRFKGNVKLTGDLSSQQVELTDQSGAYINFTKPLPGLLKSFYSNTINLPPLGTFTIYNDEVHRYDLDNYTTEQFSISKIRYSSLTFEAPYAAIYPHRIKYSFGTLNFDFPLQNEIMEYAGIGNPFTVSGNTSAVITAETIAAIGNFSATKNEAFKFTVIPFYLSSLEIEFNTLEHDYDLGLMVKTKKLVPKIGKSKDAEEADYGFDIGIDNGKWDSINLHADFPITVVATPPISLSDFMLGVSGLATADQGKGFGNTLANLTFTGSTDISILKLKDIFKNLGSIFGDVALATLDDTSASIRINNFKLQFSTTLKLLGAIDIGKTELYIGQYDYSNYLLGIDETETSGLHFLNSRGFNWDQANIKINMNGKTNITMNNYFSGIWANGQVAYDIKFVGRHKNTTDGNALIGFHNNAKQFSIIIKSSNLQENKDAGIKLTFSDGKWLPNVNFY